jgi:Tfp pilus assembly protein PilN
MRNPFQKQVLDGGSFLPADYITRRAETRANLITLSLFGVVMFGVVAAYFVTNREWLGVRDEQQAINEQYEKEAQKIEQLKVIDAQKAQLMEKASVTNALVEKVPRRVLIEELVAKMPENVTLTELKLQLVKAKTPSKSDAAVKNLGGSKGNGSTTEAKAGKAPAGKKGAAKPGAAKTEEVKTPKVLAPTFDYKLTLAGVAKSNNDVADYLAGLKSSPIFENVDIKFIQPKQIEKVELRGFEIEMAIRKNADARGMEPMKALREGTQEQPEADRAALEAVKAAVDAFKSAVTGSTGGGN